MKPHPRIRITIRGVARTLLAITIAIGLLLWWAASTGRGFLPQTRRTIWLEARSPSPGSAWEVSQIQVGGQSDNDPPAPGVEGVLRFRVEESSMGRTDFGDWGSSRFATWTLFRVADHSRGWCGWDERKDLHGPVLTAAIEDFIQNRIMSVSPAMAAFTEPSKATSLKNGMLVMSQHAFNVPYFVATVLACLVIGASIGFFLIPYPRRSSG